MAYINQLEVMLLLWIQEKLRNPYLTPAMKLITGLADDGWFWILVTALMILIPGIILGREKQGKCSLTGEKRDILLFLFHVGHMSALAMVIMLLLNDGILKNVFSRMRPYDRFPQLQVLVQRETDFSFPSGHTSASFAAGWTFYRQLPSRYGRPALILAALIGISRLYVGVHYPSDVIAGAMIGMICAELGMRIVKKKWMKV